MTQVPPPAAPAPTADPAQPPSFVEGAAMDAAKARLDAEFPQATPPGAPPALPAEVPEDLDIFDDDAVDAMLAAENLPYKDGARLKREIFKARDQFRPLRDALGTLDEDSRASFLEAAPHLGGDLAPWAQTLARLHPDDRAIFASTMNLLASGDPADVARGASELERLGRQIGGQPPAPGVQAPPAAAPEQPAWMDPAQMPPAAPEARVITEAEFESRLAERDRQRTEADHVARLQEQMRGQARELGYDPDAIRGTDEFRRFDRLLAYAQEPEIGFDLVKAHGVIEAEQQKIIDNYVKAKSEGSETPAMPVGAGGAPTNQQPLETALDARAAMLARLEGTLGPDLRARSHDG